ncbi:MAG: hypothetical protein IPP97_10095 [Candidatus Obscuribacter sp.]|nr:hypothetical protein [Candidatus Obscuribacter sp.]
MKPPYSRVLVQGVGSTIANGASIGWSPTVSQIVSALRDWTPLPYSRDDRYQLALEYSSILLDSGCWNGFNTLAKNSSGNIS